MKRLKNMLKRVIFSNKVTSYLYFFKQYGRGLSNDLLISRIQQIGHRFDHCLMKNNQVAKKAIYEMEYLLKIAVSQGLKFEDNLMWSLSLYVMAKIKAGNCYYVNKKVDNNVIHSNLLSKIILERRSVRKWNKQEIDSELIKEIISTSLWAPSSCNRQPVRVIILEESQKHFIKKYFSGTFWHDAPVQLLILCNRSSFSSTDIFFPYLDGGAFIQNMLLLLHEAGLGGCCLGFKKWNTKNEIFCDQEIYDNFYRYFGIDKSLVPISMVVAGKYDIIPKGPSRQSLEAIIIGGTK